MISFFGQVTLRPLLFLSTLSVAALGVGSADAADLTVMTLGIAPGPGAIRIVLYKGPDGFRHEGRAFQILSAPSRSTAASVTFHNIPPGQYAVLAYDDENDDKKLNLNFGMFPKEGWGLSNDPKVMGPPSFKASAFDVGAPPVLIKVHMHY